MKHVMKLAVIGLALAALVGCGRGKDHDAEGPLKPIKDSDYIEIQAQLELLSKKFRPMLEGNDTEKIAFEKANYEKAQGEVLTRFGVSLRDVDGYAAKLEKSGDTARIQAVAIAISERMTEIEVGN